METEKQHWLEEYQRIKTNPIYFIELYYNAIYPNEKIELTDEEKQIIFDKYRTKMIPLLNEGQVSQFDPMKRIDELRKQGYKDWEIL